MSYYSRTFALTFVFLLFFTLSGCVENRPKYSQIQSLSANTVPGSSGLAPVFLLQKEYKNKNYVLNIKLPQECNFIYQERVADAILSFTSDNGKGSTCADNINLMAQEGHVSEEILDEQIEESTAIPNTTLGEYTGTLYEGRTAEGGAGYSFDFISNGKEGIWFNYIIYPRSGREAEFDAMIVAKRDVVEDIISSIHISSFVQ